MAASTIISTRPPQLNTAPVYTRKFRFTANGTGVTSIYVQSLLGVPGVYPVTSLLGYGICAAVKLDKIEMWGALPSASSTMQTYVVCDYGMDNVGASVGRYDAGQAYTDISTSSSNPAHLVCRPNPKTEAGFWHSNVATIKLAVLEFQIGAIVDITVSYVLSDGGNQPYPPSYVLVGGVVGATVYNTADGATAGVSGSYLYPVGLASRT